MEINVVDFTKVGAYVIIFAFLWRSLAARLASGPDGSTGSNFGKAMGFIL